MSASGSLPQKIEGSTAKRITFTVEVLLKRRLIQTSEFVEQNQRHD